MSADLCPTAAQRQLRLQINPLAICSTCLTSLMLLSFPHYAPSWTLLPPRIYLANCCFPHHSGQRNGPLFHMVRWWNGETAKEAITEVQVSPQGLGPWGPWWRYWAWIIQAQKEKTGLVRNYLHRGLLCVPSRTVQHWAHTSTLSVWNNLLLVVGGTGSGPLPSLPSLLWEAPHTARTHLPSLPNHRLCCLLTLLNCHLERLHFVNPWLNSHFLRNEA